MPSIFEIFFNNFFFALHFFWHTHVEVLPEVSLLFAILTDSWIIRAFPEQLCLQGTVNICSGGLVTTEIQWSGLRSPSFTSTWKFPKSIDYFFIWVWYLYCIEMIKSDNGISKIGIYNLFTSWIKNVDNITSNVTRLQSLNLW